MNPVHKNTVLAAIRKTGVWEGAIAPAKVSEFHVLGGWHAGSRIRIEFGSQHDRPAKYVVTTEGQRVSLERYLSSFEYHNCNPELGTRVRFWQ